MSDINDNVSEQGSDIEQVGGQAESDSEYDSDMYMEGGDSRDNRRLTQKITTRLLRFGGIDINIKDEFKKRYATLSPSNNMVSLQSVYQALTFVAIDNIKDLNGAIIDLDSGMRHT